MATLFLSPSEEIVIEARDLAYLLLQSALEKKAQDPVLLDVEGLVTYADFFVICSGISARQVQAITEWVETNMRKAGVRALSVEGQTSGKWVLMDYGTVVLHVFYEPVRQFYDLEGLWSDARKLDVPDYQPLAEPGESAASGFQR